MAEGYSGNYNPGAGRSRPTWGANTRGRGVREVNPRQFHFPRSNVAFSRGNVPSQRAPVANSPRARFPQQRPAAPMFMQHPRNVLMQHQQPVFMQHPHQMFMQRLPPVFMQHPQAQAVSKRFHSNQLKMHRSICHKLFAASRAAVSVSTNQSAR